MSTPFRRILLVAASPIEAKSVLDGIGGGVVPAAWTLASPVPTLDLLVTGVGKANAAGATGRFADPAKHDLILNVGVAGTLGSPGIGDLVASTASIFADEGLETPDGFRDCFAMGFPLANFKGSAVPTSETANRWLMDALRLETPFAAPVATVSTCSGTDALAARVVQRTGAVAEAMEGAAVGLVAHRLGVAFAELRVISNTTGNRNAQRWDMKAALSKLSAVIGGIAQSLRG